MRCWRRGTNNEIVKVTLYLNETIAERLRNVGVLIGRYFKFLAHADVHVEGVPVQRSRGHHHEGVVDMRVYIPR